MSCFTRDIPSSWVMQRKKKKHRNGIIRKQEAKNKCGVLCWQEGGETDPILGSPSGCQKHLGKQKRRDSRRQKRASSKIGRLQISQVFRKTEVSPMSLSREQSICNYHHATPQRWSRPAGFVFIEKNLSNNGPDILVSWWGWDPEYVTSLYSFHLFSFSQKFSKSLLHYLADLWPLSGTVPAIINSPGLGICWGFLTLVGVRVVLR